MMLDEVPVTASLLETVIALPSDVRAWVHVLFDSEDEAKVRKATGKGSYVPEDQVPRALAKTSADTLGDVRSLHNVLRHILGDGGPPFDVSAPTGILLPEA